MRAQRIPWVHMWKQTSRSLCKLNSVFQIMIFMNITPCAPRYQIGSGAMVVGPPSQESPIQQTIHNSKPSETMEFSMDLFQNLTDNLILNFSYIDDIDPGEINAVHGLDMGYMSQQFC